LGPLLERLRQQAPPPVRHGGLVPPASPPVSLAAAELVYVQRGGSLPPLSPPYAGPFRVLRRGPKFFTLRMGQREETVSVDRLKPHLGLSPSAPAEPPLRGRPRLHPPSSDASRPVRTYAAVVAGGGYCSGGV
jgi:hypothetical protein